MPLSIKPTKIHVYSGVILYTLNMFDLHDKTLEFKVLSDNILTMKEVECKVREDYHLVLGMVGSFKSINYSRHTKLLHASEEIL